MRSWGRIGGCHRHGSQSVPEMALEPFEHAIFDVRVT